MSSSNMDDIPTLTQIVPVPHNDRNHHNVIPRDYSIFNDLVITVNNSNISNNTNNSVDNTVDNKVNNIVNTHGTTPQRDDGCNPVTEIHVDLRPPPPIGLFIGRDSDLKIMKESFQYGIGTNQTGMENEGSAKRRVFVIYGLGGSGKTQLALKFAELHMNWYRKRFFVDASNREMLQHRLTSITKQLEPAQPGNWLLIFDNLDHPSLNPEQHFPNSSNGNIIITTRDRSCTNYYAPQSNICLGNLRCTDAITLLLKASMMPSDDETFQSAASLVKELDGLPLAIQQASAYITKCAITIEEYLGLFKERRKHLLRDYDRIVYSTWDISHEHLDTDAKDFLKICAFLHKEGIPKWLFQEGIPQLLVLQQRLLAPQFNDKELLELEAWRTHWMTDGKWDSFKFNCTVAQLSSYSLITVTISESPLFSLHTLVHSWARDSLDADISKSIHKIVTKLICISMEEGFSIQAYKSRHQLLPHMLAITDHYEFEVTWQELDANDRMIVAQMYFDNGMYAKAEELQRQELERSKEALGRENPATLKSMRALAQTYLKQERFSEAKELHLRVLKAWEMESGGEHPEALESVHNIGRVYFWQGELSKAQKVLKRVLEVRKRVLGEKHPDTLSSMHCLAAAYLRQGQLTDAQKLHSEALEARKSVLGEKHPDTLSTMNCLGLIYRNQGQFAEAQNMYMKVVEGYKSVLGESHPDTLDSMYNLAVAYFCQGQYAKARNLLVEVVEGRKRVLGEEHLKTKHVVRLLQRKQQFLQDKQPKNGTDSANKKIKDSRTKTPILIPDGDRCNIP